MLLIRTCEVCPLIIFSRRQAAARQACFRTTPNLLYLAVRTRYRVCYLLLFCCFALPQLLLLFTFNSMLNPNEHYHPSIANHQQRPRSPHTLHSLTHSTSQSIHLSPLYLPLLLEYKIRCLVGLSFENSSYNKHRFRSLNIIHTYSEAWLPLSIC